MYGTDKIVATATASAKPGTYQKVSAMQVFDTMKGNKRIIDWTCYVDFAGGKPASTFGEANRQTMMAQVVDPEPEYDTLVPPTSAEHAGQAVDRYRKGAVKQPERTSSRGTGQ